MHRLIVLAAIALLAAVAAATAHADVAGTGIATQAVTGTTSDGGTFAGTMQVQDFVVRDGVVYAVGTISGTMTNADGQGVGTVSDAPFAAPAQAAQQTGCTLFSFSIGPIDINVAGLVTVHLEPIALDVRLEGLLGALLCPLLGGGFLTPAPPAAPIPA